VPAPVAKILVRRTSSISRPAQITQPMAARYASVTWRLAESGAACALAIMGMSVYMGYLLLGPLLDGQSAFDAVVSSAYLRSVA
jgi:hypothetical protein